MKNFWEKIKNNKKTIFTIASVVLVALASNIFIIKHANADAVGSTVNFATNLELAPYIAVIQLLASIIVWVLGQISTLIIGILFVLMSYNTFIQDPLVIEGWILVRDLCNMFFILLLLVIAFATILRQDGYDIKKMVPKLLIMAVLINFSRTICGLIIDASQVVMNTFMSAFNVGGNFIGSGVLVNALGLNQAFSFPTDTKSLFDSVKGYFSDSNTVVSTVGSLIFGLIALIVALTVIGIFTIIIFYRIIILWILIILSPIAYLASVFPGGEKYSSKWWQEFTKNVIIGPALAFFLWLALRASQMQDSSLVTALKASTDKNDFTSKLLSALGTPESMIRYLMVILFLVAGMGIAGEIGGVGGDMAKKGMAKLAKGGAWAKKRAGIAASRTLRDVGGEGLKLTGKALQKAPLLKNSKTIATAGRFAENYGGNVQKIVRDEKRDERIKTAKKLGFGDVKSQTELKSLADSTKGRAVGTIGKFAIADYAGLAKNIEYNKNRAGQEENKKVEEGRNTRDTTIKQSSAEYDKKEQNLNNQLASGFINDQQYGEQHAEILSEHANNISVAEGTFNKAYGKTKKVKLESERDELESKKRTELNNVETRYNNGDIDPDEKFKLEKEINVKYAPKEAEIDFDSNVKKGQHPNQVTMDAANKILEVRIAIEAARKGLASGAIDPATVSPSAHYSGEGQKEEQEERLKFMGDGSEESIRALENISKSLERLREKQADNKFNDHDNNYARSLKQGLACLYKKNFNMAAYESTNVVNNLNSLTTKDSTGNVDKPVKDMEVIERK